MDKNTSLVLIGIFLTIFIYVVMKILNSEKTRSYYDDICDYGIFMCLIVLCVMWVKIFEAIL